MIGPKAERTLLIDADILLWRACWRAGTLAVAVSRFDARVAALRRAHGGARAWLALSSRPGFRRALWAGYKAGRAPTPPIVSDLRERVATREEAIAAPALEADDVIGVLATGGRIGPVSVGQGGIIVSADKDLLSVPGLHGDARGGLRRIDRAEADRRHLLQTLTGDPSDGYRGCPGIGEKRAASLFARGGATTPWGIVRRAFEAAFGDPDRGAREALLQARLARILRAGEYDAESGRPRLWTPRGLR